MNLPRIGIVVCTYLESNQKYLDECLKSIQNLNYPKDRLEVIVKSSGGYWPEVNLDVPYFHILHHGRQTHYPEAINLGVEELKTLFGDTFDHYLLLNDDTILTKNSLIKLVMDAGDHLAMFNPISNCDNSWRYSFMIGTKKEQLPKRFYRYEDLDGKFEDMREADSYYPPGFIVTDWLPLYATLIPKKVWDLVGPLDDKFKTGQDDLDYGRRAQAKGVACLININALIFHCGGVTADQALTPEIRAQNIDYFTQKWGQRPDY